MSERFIKFIPSEEAMWLLIKKPNAFILLTIIAKRARREAGKPDGLEMGECYLGDWKECGLTEQKYRTAKSVLEKRCHVKIIETCRTRKKSTTGTTTVGTKVRLISSNVYDININTKDDRHNDRATTEQRPSNDEQEREEDKESKEDHPSIPSFEKEGRDGKIDDLFSKEKERGKASQENKIQVHLACYLTQEQLSDCIKARGSLEYVKDIITQVSNWPGRKYEIKDWSKTILEWKFKNKANDKIAENEKLGKTIENIYGESPGWRTYVYFDKQKDCRGILFECLGAVGQPYFIAFSDATFKEKCNEFIKNKKLKKREVNNELLKN